MISSKPAWSRQSDLIFYNALESPFFSHDEHFQGSVLPVEAVAGIMEVKSTLNPKSLKDAVEKIGEFKGLAGTHLNPLLRERFGAVLAFQADYRPEEIEGLKDVLCTQPEEKRVDSVFVVGTRAKPLSFLILRRPQTPGGTPQYGVITADRRSLRVFLTDLEIRLADARTRAPEQGIYMFDPVTEAKVEDVADERYTRVRGSTPSVAAVRAALQPKGLSGCPMCQGERFTVQEDLYCLVATKDLYAGKQLFPNIPVAVLVCANCGYLALHATNLLGVTIPHGQPPPEAVREPLNQEPR